jgi:hypothetical protein
MLSEVSDVIAIVTKELASDTDAVTSEQEAHAHLCVQCAGRIHYVHVERCWLTTSKTPSNHECFC